MEKEKKNLSKEEIKQIQKKTNKIVLITMAVVMLIICAIVSIVILVENNNERKRQEQIAIEESNKVTVPNLVDMTYKEAKEEIEKLGLQVDAKLGNLEDDDIVTTQDPLAEERIKKGETVTIWLKTPVTKKSDNYFGARFNKTIEEFCENYNNALNEIKGNDDTSEYVINELYALKSSDFEYYKTNPESKLKLYKADGINYTIFLYIENDSNYIVDGFIGADSSNVAYKEKYLTHIITEIYPALIMALTNNSYSTAGDIIKQVSNEKYHIKFDNNVCYYLTAYTSTITYLHATSISKEKYDEYYSITLNNTINANK